MCFSNCEPGHWFFGATSRLVRIGHSRRNLDVYQIIRQGFLTHMPIQLFLGWTLGPTDLIPTETGELNRIFASQAALFLSMRLSKVLKSPGSKGCRHVGITLFSWNNTRVQVDRCEFMWILWCWSSCKDWLTELFFFFDIPSLKSNHSIDSIFVDLCMCVFFAYTMYHWTFSYMVVCVGRLSNVIPSFEW